MRKRKIILIAMLLLLGFSGIRSQTADSVDLGERHILSFLHPDELILEELEQLGIYADYNNFWNTSLPGPYVPSEELNIVPQGLDYWEDKDWVLVTGYHHARKPSVLIVIERNTHQTIKSVELYLPDGSAFSGHVGGVAVSEHFGWTSSGGIIYGFPLKDLIEVEDGGRIVLTERFSTESKGSYVVYNEGMLWVGEYAHHPGYVTSPSHTTLNRSGEWSHAWLMGATLHETEDQAHFGSEDFPLFRTEQILAIPDEVQGAAFIDDNIWLSQSYSEFLNSKLLVFRNPMLTEEPHDHAILNGDLVPLWYLDGKNKHYQLELPPMSEEIVQIGDELDILFESPAYRKGRIAIHNIFSLDLPSVHSLANVK